MAEATQMKLFWDRGEKTALAKRCDMSPQYLGDILAARKRAYPELAAKIESEAKKMGLFITRMDLMYPGESTNPLLKGE